MQTVKVPKSLLENVSAAPSKKIAAHVRQSKEASLKSMAAYEAKFVVEGGLRFLLRLRPEVRRKFEELVESSGSKKTELLVSLIEKEHRRVFGKE